MFVFHKTAKGYSHTAQGRPCEDYSGSCEDDRYSIIAVADGHGDKSCSRSDTGSRIAVEVAVDCMQKAAEQVFDNLERKRKDAEQKRKKAGPMALGNPDESDAMTDAEQVDADSMPVFPEWGAADVKHLTDTITAEWADRVKEHYEQNKPSEEGQASGDYERLYGTTLIAGLMFDDCLILIQQGDGRCVVFFNDPDGVLRVEQPIPWDGRCVGNVTTSLCNKDAADRFRHCVINTAENPVLACFMGSDGVEDAYRYVTRMEGVSIFYKNLVIKACEYEAGNDSKRFYDYISEFLPEFSKSGFHSHSGSMDDVSVSGIVDIDAARSHIESFKKDIERYCLREVLFWYESKLHDTEMKCRKLERKVDEKQEECSNYLRELKIYEKKYSLNLKKFQTGEKDRSEVNERLEKCKEELSRIEKEISEIKQKIAGLGDGPEKCAPEELKIPD